MNKRDIKIGDLVRIVVEQNVGKRKYLNFGSDYYVTSIYLPHYIAKNQICLVIILIHGELN